MCLCSLPPPPTAPRTREVHRTAPRATPRAAGVLALDSGWRPMFGRPLRDVLAAVTPGGGKSVLPLIAASRLIEAGLAG